MLQQDQEQKQVHINFPTNIYPHSDDLLQITEVQHMKQKKVNVLKNIINAFTSFILKFEKKKAKNVRQNKKLMNLKQNQNEIHYFLETQEAFDQQPQSLIESKQPDHDSSDALRQLHFCQNQKQQQNQSEKFPRQEHLKIAPFQHKDTEIIPISMNDTKGSFRNICGENASSISEDEMKIEEIFDKQHLQQDNIEQNQVKKEFVENIEVYSPISQESIHTDLKMWNESNNCLQRCIKGNVNSGYYESTKNQQKLNQISQSNNYEVSADSEQNYQQIQTIEYIKTNSNQPASQTPIDKRELIGYINNEYLDYQTSKRMQSIPHPVSLQHFQDYNYHEVGEPTLSEQAFSDSLQSSEKTLLTKNNSEQYQHQQQQQQVQQQQQQQIQLLPRQIIEETIAAIYCKYSNTQKKGEVNVQQSLQNVLSSFKRFMKDKIVNKANLTKLLNSQVYNKLLEYYLITFSAIWLESCLVLDKIIHQIVIKFLLQCCHDPSMINMFYTSKED